MNMDRLVDEIDFGNVDHIRALLNYKYKYDGSSLISYESMTSSGSDISTDFSIRFVFDYLNKLIQASKLKDKQLVYLDLYVAGYTYQEIGERYSVVKSTVKRNIDSILRRIAKTYEKQLDLKIA